jgi:hypothetical protein
MTTNNLIKNLLKDIDISDIITLIGIVAPLIISYIKPDHKENPDRVINNYYYYPSYK